MGAQVKGGRDKKKEERRARARALARALARLFPTSEARTELRFRSPWELLVSVILSAQATDKKVNEVTPTLFARWPTPHDLAKAPVGEIEKTISSLGFFRQKAHAIKNAAQAIVERFGGKVPNSLEELTTLPGVGRKTALVVLCNAFHKNEGIPVDTHVQRFALRFGLTDHWDPEKIEKDLEGLLPRASWCAFAHRAILYGRRIAPARKYDTQKDPLVRIYPPAARLFRAREAAQFHKIQPPKQSRRERGEG
ncbi:MAG: endonuclease III [Candidatus Parcubacteria bacterium]|nr:MAG: endonuclease III [Candidatus Parcubacteria bacterium]